MLLHFHVVMRLVFGILFSYFVRVIEITFPKTNSIVNSSVESVFGEGWKRLDVRVVNVVIEFADYKNRLNTEPFPMTPSFLLLVRSQNEVNLT